MGPQHNTVCLPARRPEINFVTGPVLEACPPTPFQALCLGTAANELQATTEHINVWGCYQDTASEQMFAVRLIEPAASEGRGESSRPSRLGDYVIQVFSRSAFLEP